MGAIVTIPLILLFILLSPKKVNKEPRLTQFKQSPALRGNPKQNGQPVGIGKTVYPDKVFPTIWHYKAYWEKTIGKVSHNIHKN